MIGGVVRRCVGLLLAAGLLTAGCVPMAPAPSGAAPSAVPEVPGAAAVSYPVPANSATARLERDCPAPDPSRPLTAAQLNQAVTQSDLTYWQAADVGTSALLGDGRVFWAFGDTIRKPRIQPGLVSNSILVSSGVCLSQLLTDDVGPIVPEHEHGLSHWPMSAVRVPATPADGEGVRDVVVVYYSRVQRDARQWDFIYRGTTAAVYAVAADGVPRLTRLVELTPDHVDPGQINWGAAAAVVDTDHVYVYGTRNTGEAYVYGHELYVARAPIDRATDGAALQYWDGGVWQPDSSRAAPVLPAADGVSQTLSVDRVNGRWIALSKIGGDLGDTVGLWSSDRPSGPWTRTEVLSSPAGLDTGDLQYTPLAHPEILTTPGSLLVSVSRNTTDIDRLVRQPRLGRVLFAEIPLAPVAP